MRLISPDGTEITGTLERCPCRAYVASWEMVDGKVCVEDYAGESEMFWDDQVTVERDGALVVLDEDGTEYLASDCTLVDDLYDPDEDD